MNFAFRLHIMSAPGAVMFLEVYASFAKKVAPVNGI
jgi:hypothetical protein